jgi:hypothetical protein
VSRPLSRTNRLFRNAVRLLVYAAFVGLIVEMNIHTDPWGELRLFGPMIYRDALVVVALLLAWIELGWAA